LPSLRSKTLALLAALAAAVTLFGGLALPRLGWSGTAPSPPVVHIAGVGHATGPLLADDRDGPCESTPPRGRGRRGPAWR
jgi:hypothetical protein